jgi:N-acetylglucosaminyldiphosphoundecaprenol N-acetyl-beta-D-mannosaminyltransferase
MRDRRERISLMGMPVDAVTEREAVDAIVDALRDGDGGWVITPNLDHLRHHRDSGAVRRAFADADLVLADGMPLVWASRLMGDPLPERVTGSSLIWTLSAMAAEHGRSVYLLGGTPGTAERSATALQRLNPALQVAGTSCPQPGFEATPGAMSTIARDVVAARPDIVYVALGAPKAERLIATMRPLLPHAWWIGVGISFSFASGAITRAPRWMQRAGVEWLHRVAQEPRRLARRYFLDDAPFAARLLANAAWSGVRRRRRNRPSWSEEGK